jgi:hypothetical protein
LVAPAEAGSEGGLFVIYGEQAACVAECFQFLNSTHPTLSTKKNDRSRVFIKQSISLCFFGSFHFVAANDPGAQGA